MVWATARLSGLAVLFALGVAALGCEPDPATAIMVEIDSDIDRAVMDRVRLQIDSQDASGTRTTRLDTEYALAPAADGQPGGSVQGSPEVRLPIRIAVLPRSGRNGTVHVAASGIATGTGTENVFASSVLTFVPGRSLLLRLFLYEVCVDVTCQEGETCINQDGEHICVPEELERPECALQDLSSGRIEGCEAECKVAADCDDHSACTEDACVEGACTHPDVCADADQVCCDGQCAECCGDEGCDDGVECTKDTCEGGSCTHTSICGCDNDDACAEGVCCGSSCYACCESADCDDSDPCTEDVCTGHACSHLPVCAGEEVCCDGACQQCCSEADCEPSGDCWEITCVQGICHKRAFDDGTPCPEGVCLSAQKECVQCLVEGDCPTDDCHQAPTCTAKHACQAEPLPDRTACDGGAGRCCRGECAECCTAEDCPAPDPCHARRCNDQGRCDPVCVADQTSCGVGMVCVECACQPGGG